MHTMESHPQTANFLMNWSRDLICQGVANGLAEIHGDGFAIKANQDSAISTVQDGTKAWQESRMSSWLKIEANGKSVKHLVQIPFKSKLKTGKMDGPVLINEKRIEKDVVKVCDRLIKKFLGDLKG